MKLPAPPSLRHGSLRMRLLLGTLVWIMLSIALAGWGLRSLFQEHVHQQLQDQLVRQLDQLSASINFNAQQQVEVQPMAGDERLSQPLSGLYWQVDAHSDDGTTQPAVARSRSLWDQVLPRPSSGAKPIGASANFAALMLQDAQHQALLAVTRPLQLPDEGAPLLQLTVAADQALFAEPVQRFTKMLLLALGVLAAGLIGALIIQLRLALRPLQLLHHRLGAVRQGQSKQLEGQFPQELQPLVNEFNHVLATNADIVQRARTQAGNLAHAVHTPLSILGNAAAQEHSALARLVQEQVTTAQRQVDYHLARARAASAIRATGMSTPVQEPVQALLRTMRRLHQARHIHFEQQGTAAPLAFRGEAQDLFEMLGNLLDNAGKWAHSCVQLCAYLDEEGWLNFTVDDDGPGIAAELRLRIFERGERFDEKAAGTGLGLDIVRELAHTYGGTIDAQDAPLGGLRMHLRLPSVAV